MSPCFSFFIPGEETQITPDTDLWHRPLSGNSPGFLNKHLPPGRVTGAEMTIGDYFTAARIFLASSEEGGYPLLGNALSAMAGQTEPSDPPLSVQLFLEKHGAFYHPLRVRVLTETGRSASFVLNGAVSRSGLALIQKEYHLLSCFEKQLPAAYTPRVFQAGTVTLENQTPEKKEVGFFMGEWFEGFQEFHISKIEEEPQIAVWSSEGHVSYLTLERASPIYEQIAYILTACYNLDTGDHIFPWHHAAGDFVVNLLIPGFPVKLITVRGYGPLTDFDVEGTGNHILPLLLFFFLNLTLRMQLDRVDGIGKTVFLGNTVLTATLKGFFRALDDKKDKGLKGKNWPVAGPDQLKNTFISFLAGFSQEQIRGVLVNLIEDWGGDGSERTLIEAHIELHCARVHSLFKNM